MVVGLTGKERKFWREFVDDVGLRWVCGIDEEWLMVGEYEFGGHARMFPVRIVE